MKNIILIYIMLWGACYLIGDKNDTKTNKMDRPTISSDVIKTSNETRHRIKTVRTSGAESDS